LAATVTADPGGINMQTVSPPQTETPPVPGQIYLMHIGFDNDEPSVGRQHA